MASQRLGGVILCSVAVLLAAAFLWGIALQSYWALAIPVAVGTLVALALAFWVGWTMVVRGLQPSAELRPKPSTPLPRESEKDTPS